MYIAALNAQEAGAKGIIIINTEEKIFPIQDPQASKVRLLASRPNLIAQGTAHHLLCSFFILLH